MQFKKFRLRNIFLEYENQIRFFYFELDIEKFLSSFEEKH